MYKFSGDVLFTHRGISGPVILNASLFWQKGRICINFLPKFSDDEKSTIKRLFAYEFAPAGTFGFERAEVTKGGVKTIFLDENLECKSVKGLYFIGEVLDITGMLGGYNLHLAFASALKVAGALKK